MDNRNLRPPNSYQWETPEEFAQRQREMVKKFQEEEKQRGHMYELVFWLCALASLGILVALGLPPILAWPGGIIAYFVIGAIWSHWKDKKERIEIERQYPDYPPAQYPNNPPPQYYNNPPPQYYNNPPPQYYNNPPPAPYPNGAAPTPYQAKGFVQAAGSGLAGAGLVILFLFICFLVMGLIFVFLIGF